MACDQGQRGQDMIMAFDQGQRGQDIHGGAASSCYRAVNTTKSWHKA